MADIYLRNIFWSSAVVFITIIIIHLYLGLCRYYMMCYTPIEVHTYFWYHLSRILREIKFMLVILVLGKVRRYMIQVIVCVCVCLHMYTHAYTYTHTHTPQLLKI